jgi:two-component system chemotaxis response regulator CheB
MLRSTPLDRLVVVGASSGGIDALRTLAAALPPDFPAPILVVIHTAPAAPGLLAGILERAGPLSARTAEDGERFQPGHIYVPPPDHHLLVEPGRLRTTKGPKENLFRPAIDPLFRSAAQVYGPAVVGVLLTGNLDDGTAGLKVIKQLGGIAVVQHPADALFPSMPESALQHVDVDHCVPLSEIPSLLTTLLAPPVEEEAPASATKLVAIEVEIAKGENAMNVGLEEIAEPSSFACPECHGVLLRLKGEHPRRFRCHTGHAYSVQSLVTAFGQGIEDSLWAAVRSLEEAALLFGELAAHKRNEGDDEGGAALEDESKKAHRDAQAVRDVVKSRGPVPVQKA